MERDSARCATQPQFIFSCKFAFCARAEIEHVIATIFQPGGRSEISVRAEIHHGRAFTSGFSGRLASDKRNSCENSCFPTRLGPVHTYPDIFESATFSFRIQLSSTRIRRIRKQIRKFSNPLSRVEISESDNISDTCGRSNRDIF